MSSQTMNEAEPKPHQETAEKTGVSQQTHTVAENQQKEVREVRYFTDPFLMIW